MIIQVAYADMAYDADLLEQQAEALEAWEEAQRRRRRAAAGGGSGSGGKGDAGGGGGYRPPSPTAVEGGVASRRASSSGASASTSPPPAWGGGGGGGAPAGGRAGLPQLPPGAAPGAAPGGAFEQRHARYAAVGGARDPWDVLRHHVTLGNCGEWGPDAHWAVRGFRALTYPPLLPLYVVLRGTIPFAADPAAYDPQWLVVAVLCAPLMVVHYLRAYTVSAVLWAAGAGVAAAAATFAAVADTDELPPLRLPGRAFAFGPAVFALAGFAMGVVWIDSLASEVVGIVTLLAGLCAVPSGVLGLTLLAWGNSLGDFFGNQAMARRGLASTAITACWAAPLFDLLFSLALGFGAYFAKHGVARVDVAMTPELALGGGFLLAYNGAMVATGLRCGGRLPPGFAHFARAVYAAYFLLACTSPWWSA